MVKFIYNNIKRRRLNLRENLSVFLKKKRSRGTTIEGFPL